jgi:hypothetical protein
MNDLNCWISGGAELELVRFCKRNHCDTDFNYFNAFMFVVGRGDIRQIEEGKENMNPLFNSFCYCLDAY